MDELFDEWAGPCSPTRHLAGWWALRHEPFVLFVHYADLTADLEGEMRRIASFLDLEVAEDRWPSVVDRCLLDSMRTEAAEAGGHDIVFEGGAEAFFHKGGSGRWEGVLTDQQLERYDAMTSELPADAAAWLGVARWHSATDREADLPVGRWRRPTSADGVNRRSRRAPRAGSSRG